MKKSEVSNLFVDVFGDFMRDQGYVVKQKQFIKNDPEKKLLKYVIVDTLSGGHAYRIAFDIKHYVQGIDLKDLKDIKYDFYPNIDYMRALLKKERVNYDEVIVEGEVVRRYWDDSLYTLEEFEASMREDFNFFVEYVFPMMEEVKDLPSFIEFEEEHFTSFLGYECRYSPLYLLNGDTEKALEKAQMGLEHRKEHLHAYECNMKSIGKTEFYENEGYLSRKKEYDDCERLITRLEANDLDETLEEYQRIIAQSKQACEDYLSGKRKRKASTTNCDDSTSHHK